MAKYKYTPSAFFDSLFSNFCQKSHFWNKISDLCKKGIPGTTFLIFVKKGRKTKSEKNCQKKATASKKGIEIYKKSSKNMQIGQKRVPKHTVVSCAWCGGFIVAINRSVNFIFFYFFFWFLLKKYKGKKQVINNRLVFCWPCGCFCFLMNP